MKSRLAAYLTSMILAIVMILLPGFDACAETYDSETEIELSESVSPESAQEKVKRPKVAENKIDVDNSSIVCRFDSGRMSDLDVIPIDRQKIFCNFRE